MKVQIRLVSSVTIEGIATILSNSGITNMHVMASVERLLIRRTTSLRKINLF